MTPQEAHARLRDIRADLDAPRIMWATSAGPQADMYRALEKLVAFLSDALA